MGQVFDDAEMVAREMTGELQAIREHAIQLARASGSQATLPLVAKGIAFGSITARPDGSIVTGGIAGVTPDLIVRPFHQKGVVVSLREFTVNAFNHHLGMEAVERFGAARTGTNDFDEDGVPDELTMGDMTAATIFQATLNVPGRVIPDDPAAAAAIARGESRFASIGCVSCHVPSLKLARPVFTEPSPLNPEGYARPKDVGKPFAFDLTAEGEAPRLARNADGSADVRAYTDLKRHNLCDAELKHFCNEKVVQLGVRTELFLTRKLWDAGSSAPYGHRGDLSTLGEAIYWHGGEARVSRDTFLTLPRTEREEIVAFLRSLQVLPPGSPARVASVPGPGSPSVTGR
jgi:mono/diheme cytochrome c family protein